MTDSVPDLHPRNVFVHQVFASQMKRVGEMVNFLIGHQGLICLVLYNWRRPINRPVFVCVGVLEAVFIQQTLYQLHRIPLKLVKIPYLVMFGHVAHIWEIIVGLFVLATRLLPVFFLRPLDLLLDYQHVLTFKEILSRPRFEPQSFRKLYFLQLFFLRSCWRTLPEVGLDGFQLSGSMVYNTDKLIKLWVYLLFFIKHLSYCYYVI